MAKKVFVHCSATVDGQVRDFSAIRNYHIDVMGYDDIAYHKVIELVYGDVLCIDGRPLWQQGAHAYGHNEGSLGVCVVGDYDRHPPSPAHMKVLYEELDKLQKQFEEIEVIGHCEVDTKGKTCPGLAFPLQEVKERYNGISYSNLVPAWIAEGVTTLEALDVTIHDTRYQDNITRGENISLMARVARALLRKMGE